MVEEARELYNIAKRNAKHLVWLAKSDSAKHTFNRITANSNEICHIAKQMDRSNQDVVDKKCVLDGAGELSLSVDEKMKAWTEHYSKLLNIEFDWPSDDVVDVPHVVGQPPPITTEMIQKVQQKMKNGKAPGPSGVIVEMLKSAGDESVRLTSALISRSHLLLW